MQDFTSIPIVDLSQEKSKAAAAVHRACCESGFFYVSLSQFFKTKIKHPVRN